jgi:sigma-54 specific flagellar transcriptional regulator A
VAVDLKKLLANYEAAWIRESLRVASGNVTHAADLLGLPRTTFIERLRKYELSNSRQ